MTKTSIRLSGAAAGVALAAALVAFGAHGSPWLSDLAGRLRPAAASEAPRHFQPIGWASLMPKDWFKRFRELDYGQMSDGDPRVPELLKEVEASWDSAPLVDELKGRDVKLAGYIVPLEQAKGELSEFLLVPYLGACIHTPPPPANQIVRVKAARPLKGFRAMDIVSISGTLDVARVTTSMGTSGYAMDQAQVERYVPPQRQGGTAAAPAGAG